MKTAVEWLVEQLKEYNHLSYDEQSWIFEQANKMFEEQIMNAHYEGSENYRRQYYNETYKTKTIVTEFRDGSVKVETFKSE